MNCRWVSRLGIALIACSAFQAFAAKEDWSRLGKDLTPVGAERNGSPDAGIPPWEGGVRQPPSNWSRDRGYVDPFAKDQPLVQITNANAEKHKNRLSDGLMALLQSYPEFRIVLYPTRRSVGLPQAIVEQAAKEADGIAISADTLVGRSRSTVPFPIPKSGLEVMWNHRLRYRGGAVNMTEFWYAVRDGKLVSRAEHSVRLAENAALDQPTSSGILFVRSRFAAPPVLTGTETFVHEMLDATEDSRNWWVKNDAQRRARRLTAAGYDDFPPASDELRTRDQMDGFNGGLNRYEWNLLGKREMIVPYNTYTLFDKRLAAEHVLGARSLKSDFMRYETHRVWVVEAKLKSGMRHLYPRRVFYVDEDSWAVVMEDAYDGRGKLWRVGLHGIVQFYDVQTPGYNVNIWHDLSNGAYLATGLDFESKSVRQFGARGALADFMPAEAGADEGGK